MIDMIHGIQGFSFLCLLVLVFSCRPVGEVEQIMLCQKDDVVSSKLISIEQVRNKLETSDLYLPVEISSVEEFQKGHIAGSANVWRPDFRSKTFTDYKGIICSEVELEIMLQNLGVSQSTILLLYDAKGGCDAMRLAWVFDYYGYKNYKIINGGKAAWKMKGYALDSTETARRPDIDYKLIPEVNQSMYADRNDVLAAIGDTNMIIIDTREAYEYLGAPFISNGEIKSYKKGAFVRGSIPGAVHLNWSELSDLADDHRIKCTKDLLHNLEEKGISKNKNIIVYCQSGSRSAHTAFVMKEILDYPSVRNYDGSWIEWSYYSQKDNRFLVSELTSDTEFEELKKELAVGL